MMRLPVLQCFSLILFCIPFFVRIFEEIALLVSKFRRSFTRIKGVMSTARHEHQSKPKGAGRLATHLLE